VREHLRGVAEAFELTRAVNAGCPALTKGQSYPIFNFTLHGAIPGCTRAHEGGIESIPVQLLKTCLAGAGPLDPYKGSNSEEPNPGSCGAESISPVPLVESFWTWWDEHDSDALDNRPDRVSGKCEELNPGTDKEPGSRCVHHQPSTSPPMGSTPRRDRASIWLARRHLTGRYHRVGNHGLVGLDRNQLTHLVNMRPRAAKVELF